jgi:hypothetical protein
LDSGRNPKITLRSLAERSSLRYTCVKALDGCSGTCIVRELPDEWEEIASWSEKLGVDFCGERMPGLAYKVFQSLLKASRKTPAKLQQVETEEAGTSVRHLLGDLRRRHSMGPRSPAAAAPSAPEAGLPRDLRQLQR